MTSIFMWKSSIIASSLSFKILQLEQDLAVECVLRGGYRGHIWMEQRCWAHILEVVI